MEQQKELFDLKEGRRLRDLGMEAAASHSQAKLFKAKRQAREAALSREDRTASADDILVEGLGNAAGSVWKGREWRWTGRVEQSRKTSRRAGMIKVWELLY